MEENRILYLSRNDVEAVALSMREMIAILEDMFREKGEGRVEMPPKPGIHTRPDSFIHAMPAYIPGLRSAGMKWVSGYPENQSKGLPYISGLLILNDPDTGLPISVMDCTWITAHRTGAATAVAAKYLARRESASVGIIACGVQGRSNLEALSTIFSIRRVVAYDLYPDIARKFAEEIGLRLQLKIETTSTPKDAVRGMDIVVTSGPILKNPAPVIDRGWLDEGAFACTLDFDSYWKGAAFAEADKIATDDLQQLEYYRKEGYFRDTPQPYADLGEIVAGKKPGRVRQQERIITVNLGIALSDMAVAIRIYKRACEQKIGRLLPL
jgi:ornithine cyclodeaminase/alanine dehydrogenase